MSTSIKCISCHETFEHDPLPGETSIECPHCGNPMAVPKPAGAKELHILRGAPTLAGVMTCPSCKAQIEKDSVLCVHCGYNLATGKKVAGGSWAAGNKKMILMAGGGLAALILVAVAAMVFWPEPPPPPPPFTPAAAPAAPRPAAPPAEPGPAAETPAPAEDVAPPPAAEEPPPPDPAELAAQRAEAERLEFEAKKARAQVALRNQLNTREPMYVAGDTVEVRRRNGLVHIGELQRYSGTGQNRVAVIATGTGEIGVPVVALDPPSRRRMDPDYREAFIQHLLNSRLAEETDAPPAE